MNPELVDGNRKEMSGVRQSAGVGESVPVEVDVDRLGTLVRLPVRLDPLVHVHRDPSRASLCPGDGNP
jgi:hypothetical protein